MVPLTPRRGQQVKMIPLPLKMMPFDLENILHLPKEGSTQGTCLLLLCSSLAKPAPMIPRVADTVTI